MRVLLPGVPDLSSFNVNISAFQYNLKPKYPGQYGVCAATSVARYTESMKKFLGVLVLSFLFFGVVTWGKN